MGTALYDMGVSPMDYELQLPNDQTIRLTEREAMDLEALSLASDYGSGYGVLSILPHVTLGEISKALHREVAQS